MSSLLNSVDALPDPRLGIDFGRLMGILEDWLERRRERLPLLVPVGVGVGIAIWQAFGDRAWISLLLALAGLVMLAGAAGLRSRLSRMLIVGSVTIAVGFAAIALKSAWLSVAPLGGIWHGQLHARILSVEDQSARDMMRLTLETEGRAELPEIVRVNLPLAQYRSDIQPGAIISANVRLMPPPSAALPGGYDFARTAWFKGLGATGTVQGDIKILSNADGSRAMWERWRLGIAHHIEAAMPEGSGAIGAALLVGSRGGISEADDAALRNSGMAHLLSVSGLHVTAVVGAAFVVMSRLLALVPWFALRYRVPLVAAGFSALVSIGYTLLTGAEVPTIRACVAALLVLVALSIGREAISLRLLAFGAVFVLLFWPEALAGPSFQLSFAAVGTIIVLHESAIVRRWTAAREEGAGRKAGRFLLSLLITGIAIELVLAPIALFHFHKSGVYGAFANILAIPLTTFFIMPIQMMALVLDVADLGSPFWWFAGQGIFVIRGLAHFVSSIPGSVLMVPTAPTWAFGFLILGLVWAAIMQGKTGRLGLAMMAVGITTMLSANRPDMLLTGDGRHLAIVGEDGKLILLRSGAGEYAVSMLSENAAVAGEPEPLENMAGAQCSADICTFPLSRRERQWTVLATRSRYQVPAMEMAAACRRVDIVISDRYLPFSCKPRWLKADKNLLSHSGGLAFFLGEGRINSVAEETAHQPWSQLGDKAVEPKGSTPNHPVQKSVITTQ